RGPTRRDRIGDTGAPERDRREVEMRAHKASRFTTSGEALRREPLVPFGVREVPEEVQRPGCLVVDARGHGVAEAMRRGRRLEEFGGVGIRMNAIRVVAGDLREATGA